MTGWRRDLAAAAAVEVAAGFAAAAWVNALGEGHQPVTVFTACTLAAGVADMVLVPGCLWQRGPRVVVRLLARIIAAAATVAMAVVLAIWMAVALLAFGSMVVSAGDLPLDGGAFVVGVAFLSGGAVAGFGAGLAERAKIRPGIVQARYWSHVTGGLAGAVLVSALALASGFGGAAPATAWRPLLVLAPVTLVLAGGLRHALMARDAVQTATALADPGPLLTPTLACSAICTTLGVAALLAPVPLLA